LTYKENDVPEGVWECSSDIRNDVRCIRMLSVPNMHIHLLRALARAWQV
jgi:hypothetical protein